MPTQIDVSQVAIPLLSDYKDSTRALINASISNGDSVSDAINKHTLASMRNLAERYYRRGKNIFIDGVPTSSSNVADINITDFAAYLTNLTGSIVIVDDVNISIPNGEKAVFGKLSDEYDYNLDTGVLNQHPYADTDVVLYVRTDIVTATYIDSSGLMDETKTIEKAECIISVNGVEESLFKIPYYTLKQFPAKIENPPEIKRKALIAYYSINGVNKVFYYYIGQGDTYLENLISTAISDITYPVVTVRQDSVNIIDGTDTARIADTKQQLKILGINLEDISNELSANENIDIIEEAHVTLTPSINNDSKETLKYFVEFFTDIESKLPNSKSKYEAWKANPYGVSPNYAEGIYENDFNYSMRLNYVDITTTSGYIGSVGTITKAITIKPKFKNREESYITYKEQVTSSLVKTIVVHGIETTYRAYKSKVAVVTLAHVVDTSDDGRDMVMPLKNDIVLGLTANVTNTLIAESIHLNIFAVKIQKLKWYQTKLFRIVLTIAAIAYAIYTTDFSTIAKAATLWAAAQIIIISLLDAYINMYIISQVAMLIADVVGGELALIITTIVAIYLLINGFPDFNVGNLFEVSSKELMAGMLTQADIKIDKEYNKKIDELKAEQDALDKKMQGLEDLLPDDNTLLNEQTLSEYAPVFLLGEDPNKYLERTTNVDYTTNLSTYVIDNFYENSIELQYELD